MPTVLASAFGPFLEHEENASAKALALADPALPDGWQLERRVIDVAWQRGPDTLLAEIRPDTALIIAFGQADDTALRVERFAVNAAISFASLNQLITQVSWVKRLQGAARKAANEIGVAEATDP